MLMNSKLKCLIVLSLLSLVESSTTTSTPNLLLVVLLFLEHLTGLSAMLLETELIRYFYSATPYSSKTVLGFELLDIFDSIVDEGETGRATTTYLITTFKQSNTESNLETEEDDSLIVGNVVLLAEDVLNVFLRDRSTLRVKNFNGLPIIDEKYKSTI